MFYYVICMCVLAVTGSINTLEFVDLLNKLESSNTKHSEITYIFKGRGFVFKSNSKVFNLKNICDNRNVDLAFGCVNTETLSSFILADYNFYIIFDGKISNINYLENKYNLFAKTNVELITNLLKKIYLNTSMLHLKYAKMKLFIKNII